MNNLKNKKRLSVLAISFLLVFVIGAAFAFTPGILDIEGTVSFEYNYVIWESATTTASAPGISVGPTMLPADTPGGARAIAAPTIVDERGRTDQRIEWDMHFAEPGYATLTAYVENEAAVAALLTNVVITSTLGTWDAADFGLTIVVNAGGAAFVPQTLAPEMVHPTPIEVVVTWAGVTPAGFDQETEIPAVTFTVEFDYTHAP